MGTNHHTAYSNVAPKTAFTAASMGAPLSELDRAITYADKRIIACDGAVSWAAGTLTWSGTIHIWFNSAAGLAIHNTIAAGSIALSDNEFVYVTLSETNNAVLTAAKNAIATAAASNYLAYNILVLGIRNAGDDKFYPAALSGPMQIAALDVANALLYKGVIDCSGNPNYPAADAGHVYIVSVSGKIGGASGAAVAMGDMIICNTDATAAGDHATVGTKWNIIEKTMDAAEIAAIFTAAGAETEPLDADEFPFYKIVGAALKKVTWSNIKATLKTYFDAIYTLANLGGVAHSLATAANDFIVASGAGVFVKKTLAETLTILGKGAASGLATLNGSSLVVENPANATSTATASKIPIADGSGKLDTWVSDATTAVKGKLVTAGNAKAIAGTDTASAVTPDDLKYVLDRRIQQYYGVSWNESADTYVRTGSTAGQTCGVTLADAFLPVHRRLRRCVVTDAGEVAYYLSATDSTKKEDGVTSANLDGTDGQVMVEIPKFWYRYGYSGTTHTWEVSPVPLAGFKVHEAFLSDTTEKDYLYVGAYEACLYDVSASKYVGQCYQTSVSAVFDTSDDSITIATRTGWATALAVGQKLVITGTANNNTTVTVKAIVSATKITVDENLTDETAATTVIQTQTDVTDTTGDKLCSVSGVCPITGGSTNGTRAHFRTWAENRGGGKAANDAATVQWSQLYGDANSALQLLYLTEYASFYSQSVLGYGIAAVGDWAAYNNSNPIAKTGNSNVVGNASGCTATAAITTGAGATSVYLKYRGIENLYGHIWKFIDGYKVNNNIPYLCNNFANFSDAESTDNYTNPLDVNGVAITMHNASGYQGTLELTGRAFMPASLTEGSASAKITDYYSQAAGWRVVLSGGRASDGVYDGVFYLNASNVLAAVNRHMGGRLVMRK